jgi:hypothetical protein
VGHDVWDSLFAVWFTFPIRDCPVENATHLEDFDQYVDVGRVRDRSIAFLGQLAAVGAVGRESFDGGLGTPRGLKTHKTDFHLSRADCVAGAYQVGDLLGWGGSGTPHQRVVEVADLEVWDFFDDECL